MQSLRAAAWPRRPPTGTRQFHYYTVREPDINAFAIFGGFIFFNYGMILASDNESELASVLAHETAHVTQRHIARGERAEPSGSRTGGAMLAAILIGVLAAAAATPWRAPSQPPGHGRAAADQLHPLPGIEADRVGIGLLASAGFDPQAMADFFESMSRQRA